MSQSDQLQQLLRQGIDAARQGDSATARKLLEAVVARDENNELAWIWLASSVTTQRERRICLEKVLHINPGNTRAREALNAMVGVGSKSGLDVTDIARNAGGSSPAGQNRLPFDPNSWTARIGVVVLVAVAILVLPNMLSPRPPQVTSVPNPTLVPTRPTATDAPPPTFPGVRVTRDPAQAIMPPTFTPTPTLAPTETPTPTLTPFPASEFSLLVAARGTGQTQPGLYQYRGDGSGEQGLAENIRDVSFDATGENIVFIRDVVYPPEGETPELTVGEVFTAPLANLAAPQQITSLKTHSARHPVFNPKGREILFVSDYDGDDELWTIDPITSITTQITHNSMIDRDPSWSPDGTKIVFSSDRDSPGYSELYILDYVLTPATVDPDAVIHDSGYVVTALTNDDGTSYNPVWSHDGTQIAFVNDQDGDGDIFITNVTGSRTSQLTSDQGIENRSPAWTPDGRGVAFISNAEDERFQVFLVTVAGRAVTRLTQDERQAESIVFRPDIRLRLP